jgi:hypothetical protein
MRRLAFVVVLVLAGCGADGPPLTPTANIGLNIGPDGITPQASAGVTNGILSLGLNL